MVQLSHPCMTAGKTIALTIWAFVGKVMSMVFNMLSRFVIAFLPRSKGLLISWLQSLSTVILEPKKIKSLTASTFSLCEPLTIWIALTAYCLHFTNKTTEIRWLGQSPTDGRWCGEDLNYSCQACVSLTTGRCWCSGLAAIQQHTQSLKMSLKCQWEQQVPRWPLMPIQPGCMWEGPYHLLSVCPHLHRQSCAWMNTRPWSLSSVRCSSW